MTTQEAKELRARLTKIDSEEQQAFEKMILEDNEYFLGKLKEHITKLKERREEITDYIEAIQYEKDEYHDKAIKVIELPTCRLCLQNGLTS